MATGGSSNNDKSEDTGGGFFDSIGGFFDSIGDALGGLFDSSPSDSSSSGSKGDSKSDSKSDSKNSTDSMSFFDAIGTGLASVGTGGGKSSSSSNSKDEKSSSTKSESKTGNSFLDMLADILDFSAPSKEVESKSATAAATGKPSAPSGKSTVGGLSKSSKLDKVDEKLVTILDTAAKNLGKSVDVKSGYRSGDSRQHGRGAAVDVTLYDSKGKAIPDYQSAKGFRDYEKFAQEAKAVQREMFPELEQGFRWGGYFGGKSNYGALDAMHFDLGGRPGLGMRGGTWEDGLNSKQREYFAGIESQGMGKNLESYMASRGTAADVTPTMVASNESKGGSKASTNLFGGFDLIADVMGVKSNPLSTVVAAFNNPSVDSKTGGYRDPVVTSVEGRASRGDTKESIAQARKDNDFGIADIFGGSNGRSGFGAFRDAVESGNFLDAVEQAGLAISSPVAFAAATVADGFNQSKQMNSPGPEGIGGDFSQGFLAASAQAGIYDKPDYSGSSDWSPNNGDTPGGSPAQEQQVAAVAPTPAQQATVVPPKRKPFGWSKLV